MDVDDERHADASVGDLTVVTRGRVGPDGVVTCVWCDLLIDSFISLVRSRWRGMGRARTMDGRRERDRDRGGDVDGARAGEWDDGERGGETRTRRRGDAERGRRRGRRGGGWEGEGVGVKPKKPPNQSREIVAFDSIEARRIYARGIVGCFYLPSEAACRKLGVGLTVLKRQCRKYGIKRWPFRKMKSLDRLITNVQAGISPGTVQTHGEIGGGVGGAKAENGGVRGARFGRYDETIANRRTQRLITRLVEIEATRRGFAASHRERNTPD